ncbi:hypothetical protein EOD42_07585 [Rhodovarius crocodyli]|uniref:Uncharacterized protein n=1 Tax=Rhodovarius crocodyli TaxID=1979269 RepID=A0A437MJ33_9PROT|nr:hypothetical protein [Rhodovarius crocodyli]RVT97668.1 hypothetical protein EOD42_07585 [Rhodovarius crocodyli]
MANNIIVNDAGEIRILDDNGQWVAPRRARNDETGRELFLDGNSWRDVQEVVQRDRRNRENTTAREQNSGVTGYAGGLARQALNGLTFGFGDEIIAGARSLGDITYEQALAEGRARDRVFQEDNPIAATVANVGGGVAGMLAPGGLAARAAGAVGRATGATAGLTALGGTLAGLPGASGAARVATSLPARGLALGATAGAATGFGEGEGGFGNRAAGAGQGAAVGGVVGGALGTALPLAGRVISDVGRTFNLTDPTATAERQVLRALGRDGASLNEVAANPPGGGVAALVDSGGRNLQNLTAGAANTPGPAMDTADRLVQMRRAGRPERVAEAVDEALGGGGGTRVMDEVAELQARRSAQARPLYESAFAGRLDDTALPRLAEMASDPLGQQAMQRGLRVIQMEHLAEGRAFNPEDYGVRYIRPGERNGVAGARVEATFPPEPVPPQPRYLNDPVQGRVVDEAATAAEREAYERAVTARQRAMAEAPTDGTEAGRFVLVDGQAPNLRLMDAIKRGLDDELETFRQPTGQLQLNQYGRAVEGMRRSLLDTLDGASPGYAAARAAWAGPSEAMGALRQGQAAFRTNPDVVAGQVDNLSPEARDFYRLGAGRAITDMTSDPARAPSLARVLAEDRRHGRRLEAIEPEPARRQMLVDILRREAGMADVERTISPRVNSQTARLLAQGQDDGAAPAEFMLSALTGSGGILARILSPAVRRYSGVNDSTSRELARILMDTDAARNVETVNRLRARAQRDEGASLRARMLAQAVMGGTAGGIVGQWNGR